MAAISKRRWQTTRGEKRAAWVLAFTDASGIRRKEQFAKKRDAEARRIEVENQVKTGTFRADAINTTVDDAVGDYITYLEGRHKRDEQVTALYLKTTKAHLRNYVAPNEDQNVDFEGGIGSIKLSQLTARAVGEFRDRLRDSGVGVVTTRQILGSLSRALKHAVDNDLVAVNAAAGIRVIGKRDEGAQKIIPQVKRPCRLLLQRLTLIFGLKSYSQPPPDCAHPRCML